MLSPYISSCVSYSKEEDNSGKYPVHLGETSILYLNLTLTRMAIWPLLTRMAEEWYTHGSVDVFRRILHPLSAAEDSCVLAPPPPHQVFARVMLGNMAPRGRMNPWPHWIGLYYRPPPAPTRARSRDTLWAGGGGRRGSMSPWPPQMRVIRQWRRRHILHPSSEAEDLYVLVFLTTFH